MEQGYIGMDGRRSEARLNFKWDSSSWKDEMRKGRHEGRGRVVPTNLGFDLDLHLVRQSSATTAAWANRRRLSDGKPQLCEPATGQGPWPKNDKEGCARFMAGVCGGTCRRHQG